MRWLGLISTLSLASLVVACSDSETTIASGGGGGVTTTGGMGGTADGGSGGSGAQGGAGAQGGGGQGGQGGQCENLLPNEATAPATLSATGLYTNIATKELATYVQEFTPQFPLWSDGATKTRWIYLPECDPVIDNSDEDIWQFPVGMRVWKQFERDNELLETRMIHRFGPGDDDFILVAYRWNDLDDEATLLTTGEFDVKGTEHDIPTGDECFRCHGNGIPAGGTPSRLLGFSALQLSHAGAGVTMATLSGDGSLSTPNATGYTVPGNATEQAALGYLHSNCANCHNSTPDGVLFPVIRMDLSTADTLVTDTSAYTTLVDQDVSAQFMSPNTTCTKLIDGQDIDNSCVAFRMGARGTDMVPGMDQMPPLGTSEPDNAGGVAAINAWIGILP